MTNRARLYGGSLYDLSLEEGLSQEILEEMTILRSAFAENPEYLSLLSDPAIGLEERLGLIESAFGESAHRYLVSFLKLLCERGYLLDFADCHREFLRRYNADNGISEAVVTSAIPLSEAQKTALKEKLEGSTGKKVSLTYVVDPRVLAGVKVEMEGRELDGTASGHMAGLSKKLQTLTI